MNTTFSLERAKNGEPLNVLHPQPNREREMKTYKTQAEVEADIKNGWLIVNDDVTFDCDVKIDANINARNINV